MSLNNKAIVALIVGGVALSFQTQVNSNGFEDSWSKPIKQHAKQIDDAALSQSLEQYAKNYENLVKQHGYIGKKLSIPEIEVVGDGVFFVKGALMWGTLENHGLNNNITAVELDSGVFVYNTGSNPAVAYSFHQALKQHTNKPIRWLAAENYQSHANLGGSYWHAQGVKNIYSEKQAADFWSKRGFDNAIRRVNQYNPFLVEAAQNMGDQYKTFEDKLIVNQGTPDEIHLINFGGGHTPTMTGAFIPSKNILFTGDLGFVERLPGLLHDSSYSEWMDSFEAMVEYAENNSPDIKNLLVIPGHGGATTLSELITQTYGYFEDLKVTVDKAMSRGLSGQEFDKAVHMPKYQHRPMYDQLYLRNARSVYDQMTK
ncbi:MAG: SoxH protein [Thiomicrospira sp.]|uniref:SoxH protein n=1 Tax=Thiomicrospira sp. TaxID=935 RepID=UPI0019FC17A2|nr:SoxH protein [Thiomicrospira sp.]MBE0494113.1 SoxH protein [Thiomicrospira sp.]